MLDLVVRGGTVVAPWGVGDWDVAVEGERIVAVAEPGTLPRDGGRVIDASGNVVPGGIEPHAHASLPLPYPGVRDQGLRAEPPDVISKACVFGGTTTVVDFANWRPGITLPQAIEEKDRLYRNHSYADYTFHGVPVTTILRGKVVVENGKLLGDSGDGRLIGGRKTAAEVLRGPGC